MQVCVWLVTSSVNIIIELGRWLSILAGVTRPNSVMADAAAARQLDDLILLDEISEEAIVKTLVDRYKDEEIYTYIGPVLISFNPYKLIKKDGESIYSPKYIREHDGKLLHEVSPHIFSIAEDAYRSLIRTTDDQCILVSGESGAGKTEVCESDFDKKFWNNFVTGLEASDALYCRCKRKVRSALRYH